MITSLREKLGFNRLLLIGATDADLRARLAPLGATMLVTVSRNVTQHVRSGAGLLLFPPTLVPLMGAMLTRTGMRRLERRRGLAALICARVGSGAAGSTSSASRVVITRPRCTALMTSGLAHNQWQCRRQPGDVIQAVRCAVVGEEKLDAGECRFIHARNCTSGNFF